MRILFLLNLTFFIMGCQVNRDVTTDCGIVELKHVKDSCFFTKEIIINNKHYNNRIKLPKTIFQLPYLELLMIDHIRLRRIPKDITELQNLKSLYLINNPIHEIPFFISSIDSLNTIALNNVPIKKVPIALASMKSLKSFELSGYNYLAYDTLFSLLNQINLNDLTIGYPKLRVIPKSILNLDSLKFLGLRYCNNLDLKSLVILINSIPYLEALSFTYCEISTNELIELYNIKPGITITFLGTKIGDANFEMLKDVLKGKNKIKRDPYIRGGHL